MKESLIKGIVEGFKKQNPDIDVDYQSAGAGKLMAKIAAERQSGKFWQTLSGPVKFLISIK